VKEFLLRKVRIPLRRRHLKRAIERHLVFPLANLVATSQVKLGDFVRSIWAFGYAGLNSSSKKRKHHAPILLGATELQR